MGFFRRSHPAQTRYAVDTSLPEVLQGGHHSKNASGTTPSLAPSTPPVNDSSNPTSGFGYATAQASAILQNDVRRMADMIEAPKGEPYRGSPGAQPLQRAEIPATPGMPPNRLQDVIRELGVRVELPKRKAGRVQTVEDGSVAGCPSRGEWTSTNTNESGHSNDVEAHGEAGDTSSRLPKRQKTSLGPYAGNAEGISIRKDVHPEMRSQSSTSSSSVTNTDGIPEIDNKKTNSGEKPSICQFCGKSFGSKPGLNGHMNVRSSEIQRTCEVCGESFNGQPGRHMMKHTGDKPHECGTCDKSYKRRGDLEKHVGKSHRKTSSSAGPAEVHPDAPTPLDTPYDHRLPHTISKPLPKERVPKDWHCLDKNCFIDDAAATWKKAHPKLLISTCICTTEEGCGDDCLNRVMQYECDDNNCNVGPDCGNRPFAELAWRCRGKNFSRKPERPEGMTDGEYKALRKRMGFGAGPNLFCEGVEVMKTKDRGHGVRAMRSFAPCQIVVEYCGEVITPDEADRRMTKEYKGKTVCITVDLTQCAEAGS